MGTQAMAKRWNELADADAMHFIATSQREWDTGAFLESGRDFVSMVLDWVGDDIERKRMLEIGCGLCRTAVHFSAAFEHVDGVDISRSMIEQARTLDLPRNIQLHVTGGADLGVFRDETFDLVYCGLVLQHIADVEVIQAYLHDTARVLRTGGLAVLQFDSRPQGITNRLYKSLPDMLLPARHRRFIRRYRRKPADLEAWFNSAGLTVTDQRGADTAGHWYRLRRTESPE